MNYLMAKIKGTKGNTYKVLSDDNPIIELKEITDAKDYESSYKLEEDEWFKIELFSQKEYCIDFLKKSFSVVEYNQLPSTLYTQIEYLCIVQGNNFIFQKLSASQIAKHIGLLSNISNTPKLTHNNDSIIINDVVNVFYNGDADTLFFKDLGRINSIFCGIDILYREATKEETESFLNNGFINLVNGYNANSVKTLNRRRIAKVIDTINNYNSKEKTELFNYINEYCSDVPYKDGIFDIGTEEHLKRVVFGIEEKYYTTNRTNEKRLANSTTKLDK